MSESTADTLDLSRLPSPTLVPIDYEAILEARRTALVDRFATVGIDYDVSGLESDPGMIVEEVDAYRETLGLQAINDAGRANMLAFSSGADLEHLGAFLGVTRLQVGTDANGAPIMELDDRLRRRIQLRGETFALAGSAGGYAYWALTAAPTLADVSVQNPQPGYVVVTVMGSGNDPTPSAGEVEAVRAYLAATNRKVVTDVVQVQPAEVIPVDLQATLTLYPGPDSSVVVTDALAALDKFLAANRKLGRDLRLKAWVGRLERDTVFDVEAINPAGSITASPSQVLWVRSRDVTVGGLAT